MKTPEDLAVQFADEHFDKFLKDSNLWDAMCSAFMSGYNTASSHWEKELEDEKEYQKGIQEQIQRDAAKEIDKYRQ